MKSSEDKEYGARGDAPRREPIPRRACGRSRRHLAAGILVILSLSACAPQTAREELLPTPEEAAVLAIQLEPGPPPPVLISPELLWRSAKLLELKKERLRRQQMQMDSTVAEVPDSWARIRARLSLSASDRSQVLRQIEWYQRNQDYIDRMADRARFYLPHIVREVENRGLPLDLALLPIVESAFQPFAYSPAGAAGIWQFMPATGRLYGLKQNWWYDGRRDIVESTRAALDYLEKLSRDFDGDWLLAVAAYNWGEGNVRRAIRRNERSGKDTDFWSLRVPRETRAYVPRLLALSAIVADPEKYQLRLPPIDDDPYFLPVKIDSQIDLAHAADLADITLEELYVLNPGFNRWATDPDGPHRLLLPEDSAKKFTEGLAQMPPEERIEYRRHEIARGESLLGIAERYRTSVKALRTINSIEGSIIRAGDSLMVPVASRSYQDYKLSNDIRLALARANRVPANGVKVKYRVRNGDSLWLIARRHDIRVKDLARWNNISTRKVIRPGQRLVIWKSKPYPAALTTPVNGSASEYVVRRGDTLSGIARRFGTTAAKIALENKIQTDSVLMPGQELRLPGAAKVNGVDQTPNNSTRKIQYTVRAGDSLWLISRRFNVSVDALRKWNSLHNVSALYPGQKLDVFVAANESLAKEG